jgi:hypothetical protein
VDPSNPQSWNRYAYALNNPLAVTDPTGLCNSDDPTCNCDPIFGCCDPIFGWCGAWPTCMFAPECGTDGGGGGSCDLGGCSDGNYSGYYWPPAPPPPQAPPPPAGSYGAGIDPYGTWDESVPNGVQVFPTGFPGIPGGAGCTYGSGNCGGIIYGFQNVPPQALDPNFWIRVALLTSSGKGDDASGDIN